MHVLTATAAQRTCSAPRARGVWPLKTHLRWGCQTLSLLAPQRPQPPVRQSRLWVCQRRVCCLECQRAHWTLQSPRQTRQRTEPQTLGSTAPQTLEWRLALRMQAPRWGLQMQTAARKDEPHIGSGVAHSEQAARCIRSGGVAALVQKHVGRHSDPSTSWLHPPNGKVLEVLLDCHRLSHREPTPVWPKAGLPPKPLPNVLLPRDACSARGATVSPGVHDSKARETAWCRRLTPNALLPKAAWLLGCPKACTMCGTVSALFACSLSRSWHVFCSPQLPQKRRYWTAARKQVSSVDAAQQAQVRTAALQFPETSMDPLRGRCMTSEQPHLTKRIGSRSPKRGRWRSLTKSWSAALPKSCYMQP